MALLEVKRLHKNFRGLRALLDVDLSVEEGEIVGLIGPNGAGKTTLFNVITGYLRPTAGQVRFRGEEITRLKPHSIARRGIARIFQTTSLFEEATVLDNVVLGHYIQSKVGFWRAFANTHLARRKEQETREKATQILEFIGISDVKDWVAKNLPYGYQRELAVAIALAVKPKLLLLDEPVSGMSTEENLAMMRSIKEIRDTGVTIIVVEHNMRAVMGLSDRIVVLNEGVKIAEGSPKEITENENVIEAYLGAKEEWIV